MSFREKTAWISLVSFVVVYGLYFWRVVDAGLAGETGNFLFSQRLVGTVVLLIIIQIVLTSAVAIRVPKEASAPMDEREKLIALKAVRNAFHITSVCLFLAFVAVGLGAPAFYVGNGLFFVLVLSEIVRAASQIAYCRMDA